MNNIIHSAVPDHLRGARTQIYRIMRLSFIFIFAALMQVSASTTAQKITLSERNSPLAEVLQKIKIQSGIKVLYADYLMKEAKKVTVKVSAAPLEQVLEQVFEHQTLQYELKDQTLVITRKEPSTASVILNLFQDLFQSIDVRGRVVDSETGAVLAGATVRVKGTSQMTKTNGNGEFYLANVKENVVLEISFIGYVTQELKAKKDLGGIKLVMASAELQEVTINKGYYTESKKLSTGSVARVTAEEIEKQPVNNPLAAIIGRMAGVRVEQTTGVPGGSFKVQIRGQNSLRPDGNDPLYIVDGVPYGSESFSDPLTSGGILNGGSPLNFINQSDIETIEVLKDADATSIYGSRGANGVVLITTKKVKLGKTTGDIKLYSGAGNISRKMDLLNTRQYLDMRYESFSNDHATPTLSNAKDLLLWDTTRYTDWQKKLIGGTAHIYDLQASINAGNSNTQFSIRSGYHQESTVFPGDFRDIKSSIHTRIMHASENKRFNLNFTAGYLHDKSNLLYDDLTSWALELPPVAPHLYNPDGTLNWENSTWLNPLAYTEQPFKSKTQNLLSNANLSYNIISNLELKISLGYTSTQATQNAQFPSASFDPTSGVIPSSRFANNDNNSWIIEPLLNWKRAYKIGKIDVLLGATFQERTRQRQSFVGTGYSNEALMETLQAATVITPSSTNFEKYNYSAAFARINYSYQEKYIINLTGRRDGSSRFGPGKQFANFGAAGLAWIFTNESVVHKRSASIVSFGKARASYGITGSDQIGDYGFLDLYTTSSDLYQGSKGLKVDRLVNPDYSWETNKKFEVALELGILNNRIFVNSIYYRNRSGNQLVGYPLSLVTGFPSIQYNMPAVVQNTGFEFELQSDNIRHSRLTWTSSMNFTISRNKLISFPGIEGTSYATRYEIGLPLSIVKAYDNLGVDPNTGIYSFRDYDQSGGALSSDDLKKIIQVGPKLYGGLNNSVTFKNFQFDCFLQYVNQTALSYLSYFRSPGGPNNQPTLVLNRWRNPGDVTDVQKFTYVSGSAFNAYRDAMSYGDTRYVDASFIRLKNVSLSYSFLPETLKKLSIQHLSLFMNAQNLFTFTKFQGLDPESGNFTLPPLAIYTLGLQLNL